MSNMLVIHSSILKGGRSIEKSEKITFDIFNHIIDFYSRGSTIYVCFG